MKRAADARSATVAVSIALIFVLAAAGTALAEEAPAATNTLTLDPSAPPVPGRIESLAWLAGAWRGEGLGGQVEETWSQPLAGTMMGTFKLVRDGEIGFYEFVLIRERGDSLVLELKHFTADLVGWEEKADKVSFPLVKIGDNEVFFSGLTYRLVGDTLHAFVSIRQGDEPAQEVSFSFKRHQD